MSGVQKPVIRTIGDGDYDDVCRLNNADSCPLSKNDPRHPYNAAARIIEESHDPQSQGRGWFAVAGGEVAGIITTENFGGGIIVDPKFRGQGIAGHLIRAREEFLRAQGQTTTQVHILAGNTASIHAFTKAGYAFDKKSADVIAAHGGDRAQVPQNTVLVMERSLETPKPDSPRQSVHKSAPAAPKTP